jgi:hypothetical protein
MATASPCVTRPARSSCHHPVREQPVVAGEENDVAGLGLFSPALPRICGTISRPNRRKHAGAVTRRRTLPNERTVIRGAHPETSAIVCSLIIEVAPRNSSC